MMYALSVLFVAGAQALVDNTNNKIKYNAHDFAAAAIVRVSADTASLLAAKMYVVDAAPTANEFALKTFTQATAAGNAAQTLAAVTAGAGTSPITMTEYTKACLVTAIAGTSGEITCEDNVVGAADDKFLIYCEAAGGTCQLNNADLASLSEVYALAPAAKKLKVSTTKGGYALVPTAAATGQKVWLLKASTKFIYPNAPAIVGGANSWDLTANQMHCNTKDIATTCIQPATTQWYYMGNGETATAGLDAKTVYSVKAGANMPWAWELYKSEADTDKLKVGATKATVTAAGAGNEFRKLKDSFTMVGSFNKDDLVVVKNAAVLPVDAELIFYCIDTTTAADCQYNVTGMASGNEYKIHTASVAGGTGEQKFPLKAGTVTTKVAVTADSKDKTKGFMLHAETAAAATKIAFPAGKQTTSTAAPARRSSATRNVCTTVLAGVVAVAVAALA
jgi:hypothetical protein